MRVVLGEEPDAPVLDLSDEEAEFVLGVARARGCTPFEAVEFLLAVGRVEWERRPLRLVAGPGPAEGELRG